MEKEAHGLSWRDKIARSSLALSVAWTVAFPQPPSDEACEQAVVQSQIELEEAPLLGFTFRPAEAEYVGLDPKHAMEELLKMDFDLVRISMYPNQPIEQMIDNLAWQIDLADQYETDIVLVVGRKNPGYPEEYLPRHAHQETLDKTAVTLERFADHPRVKLIQVSNEPLYSDFRLEAVEESLLQSMVDLIQPYGKQTLFTHLADPVKQRTHIFEELVTKGDSAGIDVYLETAAGRSSCLTYSSKLQVLEQIAYQAEKPLLVTELQTLPWPDTITVPFFGTNITLSRPFQQNLEPAEIRKLYKLVLMNTDAESIFFWEMVKNLSDEQRGDSRRMNEVRRIIGQNHETREQLLYQREQDNGGLISFSADHSSLGDYTSR